MVYVFGLPRHKNKTTQKLFIFKIQNINKLIVLNYLQTSTNQSKKS